MREVFLRVLGEHCLTDISRPPDQGEPRTWRYECPCGWVGVPFDIRSRADSRAARAQADGHVAEQMEAALVAWSQEAPDGDD